MNKRFYMPIYGKTISKAPTLLLEKTPNFIPNMYLNAIGNTLQKNYKPAVNIILT
jgi:hypothetical protein